MKLRIFSLFVMALIVFACSTEDTTNQIQNGEGFTIKNQNVNGQSRNGGMVGGSGFICDPNWVAPEVFPWDPIVDKTIQVYWSDNPNDWPLGIIDIECARQEYFDIFCGMYMSTIQPTDPWHEVWLRDFQANDCWQGVNPKSKDHVDTQSNDDPRVCTGPNCD